ncbi:hypothetical protein D3261_01980 [Halococcus sp. IIIV-5B]|nr:hypothetical protein D3261_01980 [Halococcus sp. IIIV-5B]
MSGDVEGNNGIESNDSVGSDGQVAAAVDSYDQDNYRFSGDFEYFNYSGGDLRVTVDGQSKDPDNLGGSSSGGGGGGSSLPNGVTIVGHQSDQINYSFGVSGDLEGNSDIESNDSVGSDGQVAAAVDSYDQDNYRFSGDFEYFNYSGGDLRVTVNGQSKNPDNLGGSSSGGGGGSSLPKGMTVVGHQSGQINYSFGVSGDLEGNNDIESNDSVGSDGQAAAAVDSYDQDNYRFSGEVEYFNYSGGDLRLTIDGQSRDPDSF